MIGTAVAATETRRILVVDDEETILDATSSYFASYGFRVDCAREREEAEALVSTCRYSLVIADMRLTGVHGREGLELLGYLRERCPWAVVIVLTAYGSGELERETLRRGAHAFLEKPLPLSELARIAFGLLGSAA
ncbi:MAG: response regulator [Gemmatimonadetes bacterium]|nr:response regulator [Gemmatimonadota bacterium]